MPHVALLRMQGQILGAQLAQQCGVAHGMRAKASQHTFQIGLQRARRSIVARNAERAGRADHDAQAITAPNAQGITFFGLRAAVHRRTDSMRIGRAMVASMPESMSFGDAGQPGRQRIVVLGASGFIGRRVLQMLAASEWAAPVGASRRAVSGTDHGVEMLALDATQGAALQAALKGAAGVVNCVAGDSDDIVAGARALFDAASRMTPVPRIVHLSTMMVYGTAVGDVDEGAPLKGDWDDYSAAKAEVERLSRSYGRVVNLRPGIVYGPHSPVWSGWIGQWLRQGRIGDLAEAGLGCCNLVHVDDVVEAVARGLRLPGIEGEAFNLSLSSPPTWNDYFRQYAEALGVAVRPISHTRLMIEKYLLAPPLKMAQLAARFAPFDAPQPIRPWFLRLCGHAQRLDVRKAERELGMRWMPLEQGLRQTAAWLKTREGSRGGS